MIILVNLTCSKCCALGVETGTQEETKGHPSQMGKHTQHLNFTSSVLSLPSPPTPTSQDLFLLHRTHILSRLRCEAIWFHHAPSSPIQPRDCNSICPPHPTANPEILQTQAQSLERSASLRNPPTLHRCPTV